MNLQGYTLPSSERICRALETHGPYAVMPLASRLEIGYYPSGESLLKQITDYKTVDAVPMAVLRIRELEAELQDYRWRVDAMRESLEGTRRYSYANHNWKERFFWMREAFMDLLSNFHLLLPR